MINLNHIHNEYITKISKEKNKHRIKLLNEQYKELVWYYGLNNLQNYQEVKNCPFCGEPAQFSIDSGFFQIRCSNVECHMNDILCTLSEWNNRIQKIQFI